MTRLCSGCQQELGARNLTGRCRGCFNRLKAKDPDFCARRDAGMAKKWADPVYRAKMALKGKVHAARLNTDPVLKEKRRKAGAWTAANVLFRPDVREKTLKAVRKKSGKTQSASRLAWCPPEYHELYWFLRRTKRLTLAECKEAIRTEQDKAEAKLSPFERADRAMQRGAKLVDMGTRATLDRPGVYRS